MDSSSSSKSRRRNWEDMPLELLGLISDKLEGLVTDFIHFGAVCKSWSLAVKEACNRSRRISYLYEQEPPMLLIPHDEISSRDNYGRLYSIWENKIYTFPLQLPRNYRYFGSGYGWLAFVDKFDYVSMGISVTLLNPFGRKTIPLPTMTKIRIMNQYYLKKVILSCDPCLYPDDWIVVVILGSHLAFIRSGQESWNNAFFAGVDDACFYQGNLYMIDNCYKYLVAIDFSKLKEKKKNEKEEEGLMLSVTKIKLKPPHGTTYWRSYLVELGRDLLLVSRIKLPEKNQIAFKVWKLRSDSGNTDAESEWIGIHDLGIFSLLKGYDNDSGNTTAKSEWIEIDNLGKFSLFWGLNNDSVAIYDSSNVANFQANCIYYTDTVESPYFVGIYNLVTGHISRHCVPHPLHLWAALWISPTLERK